MIIMSKQPKNEFEKAAKDQKEVGLVREFIGFLRHNKKWHRSNLA